MASKVAGILGGMGPEATIDLMRRIVACTHAKDDADHVACIVDQNTHVPSRIKNLLEDGGESPGPCLAQMGRRLEKAGADFLCIACNTAHNWHEEVAAAVNIPVLNIIDIASAKAAEITGSGKAVGILASPAVRMTGLYEKPFNRLGLTPVYPDEGRERELLEIIKRIKAGEHGSAISKEYADIARDLRDKGASALMVACTELGVLGLESDIPVIDAADELARAVALEAGAKLRQ